ncbi:hypothetical protein Btru_016278 [Bulinus truncatus]|nr:hypothetical protein Btru_016278 [Bulinus truncatus]
MAVQLLKNATKVSLVGGALYWSVNQGIWGTCDEGAEVGRRLAKSVWPTSEEQKPKGEAEKIGLIDQIAANWNASVSSVFTYVSNLPDSCKNCTSKIQSTIKDLTSGQKSA